MDSKKLLISSKCLGDSLMLTEVLPYKKYENGKPTEEIEGYRYVVACPNMGLDKIGIKIKGKQQMANPDGTFPIVRFSDLEVRPYVANGVLALTATATAVTEVNSGK